MIKQISDNEIYLLIKYIKSVLWRVAKCLSYIEEARCLNIKATGSEKGKRCCAEMLRWRRGEIEVPFFFIEMKDAVAQIRVQCALYL